MLPFVILNLSSLLLSYCYGRNKLLHIRFQRCLGNPFFFGLQYVRKGMLLCVNNKNEYINFCPILYGTKDLHSQKQFGLMSIVISLTHVQRATFELKLEIKVHRIHIFRTFFVVFFYWRKIQRTFALFCVSQIFLRTFPNTFSFSYKRCYIRDKNFLYWQPYNVITCKCM